MEFKKFERVEYKKNTLFEVVFQARFPQILKIRDESPVAFQDTIRQMGYPESITESPTLPPDVPEGLRRIVSEHRVYAFISEDGDWKVSLSKDFVALSCLGHYQDYTEFKNKLVEIMKIFDETYKPSYFTRIGLRYRNLINKHVLGDGNLDIRAIVPTHIAPELHEDIKNNLASFEKITQYEDAGSNKVNVSHAFATVSGKYGRYQINEEESYFVDIDCFIEQKTHKVEDAISTCDTFNETVRNIFRWSIGDSIHLAMEPKN